MDQNKSSVKVISRAGTPIDAKAVENARDILHQLGNTVSAMKIYPSDHVTIKYFIDELTQKFTSFLDAQGKLEIAVAEYSFFCGDKVVYTDEMTIKSLPFFFFKDGMQMLYFYQGLDRGEIGDFLELIKSESQKPGGEGDIVTALWERDFSNIQYYAPDDYLENRIIEERTESQTKAGVPMLPEYAQDVIEIKVDMSKFTTGKIELTPEDKADVQKLSADKSLENEEQPRFAFEQAMAEGSEESRKSPAAAMDPTLTEAELQTLETLVRANRTILPDEEFLNLMIEILNLEKGLDGFGADLDVLADYHHEQLEKGNFGFAIPLVHKVRELRTFLASSNREKAARLDAFLATIISPKTVEAIQNLLEKSKTVDWNALVDFFVLMAGPALPLAADVYESVPDPKTQEKILEFMNSVNAQDPRELAAQAADERPQLSRAIIGLLSQSPGKKGLPHFSVFLGLKNKEIKLEAIRALGQFRDEMANRILLGFLDDKDEDIRIQAALKLNPVEEISRIQHLIREAEGRSFRDKSLKEKQAILSFLGRTQTEEAMTFLRKVFTKRGLWMSAKARDMKLAAVSGLEGLGTGEAAKLLEKGAQSRDKALQEACSRALARLAQAKTGQA
ncbi:MAG: HEAT repeat domain-containing protein [Candidatus Aminicenantales bacterium]